MVLDCVCVVHTARDDVWWLWFGRVQLLVVEAAGCTSALAAPCSLRAGDCHTVSGLYQDSSSRSAIISDLDASLFPCVAVLCCVLRLGTTLFLKCCGALHPLNCNSHVCFSWGTSVGLVCWKVQPMLHAQPYSVALLCAACSTLCTTSMA